MEDFFFFREIARNPEIFTAQVNLENIAKERQAKNAKKKRLKQNPQKFQNWKSWLNQRFQFYSLRYKRRKNYF